MDVNLDIKARSSVFSAQEGCASAHLCEDGEARQIGVSLGSVMNGSEWSVGCLPLGLKSETFSTGPVVPSFRRTFTGFQRPTFLV